MTKKLKNRLSGLLAVLMLALQLPLTVGAASVTDAVKTDAAPPISAAADQDDTGKIVGDEIIVTVRDDTNYLFLPASADASQVLVRYNGTKELYQVGQDTYIQPGGTGKFDFSAGDVKLYEYDKSADKFYEYTLRVMKSAQVSAMHFQIDDVPGYEDIFEYLHENKENETTGALVMVDSAGQVVYDGGIDTFKGRGNTSFVAPGIVPDKKSYNIKLSKKTELIDGAGKMKKWSLLHMRVSTAYHYDWTGMCSRLGFQTYNQLVGEGYFDMRAEYVDVYINDEYRGTYILTERMDVNAAVDISQQDDNVTSSSSARTTVRSSSDEAIKAGVQHYIYTTDAAPIPDSEYDPTGGYLMEVDFGTIEECGFLTKHGMYVNLKAPEVCTKEQVQYIAKYVQEFENALMSQTGYNSSGKHYTEYIDANSLASMILTYAFYENWELFRTSTYMYKDTDDSEYSKLTFGPAWDFETGDYILNNDKTLFGTHNVYSDRQQYIWLEALWEKGDFMKLLTAKERELDELMTATLGDVPAAGIVTAKEMIEGVTASQAMNWARWGFKGIIDKLNGYSGKENTFTYFANQYRSALKTRHANWNKLWDDSDYLLGMDVTGFKDEKGKILLVSRTNTTADVTYRWYKANAGKTGGTLITGAEGAVLQPEEEGVYYCVVTGPNNAYCAEAKGSTFASENISMTAIFDTADAVLTGELPDCEHTETQWTLVTPATCTEQGVEAKICLACGFTLETRPVAKAKHTPGDWEIVKQATEEEEGYRCKYCTVCKAELEREAIDKIYRNPFDDVEADAWYASAVQYAVQNELFFGMSDTVFAPEGQMTRAMLVSVIARMEGITVDNTQSSDFEDVKSGKWYTGAVVWAAEHNIVAGVSKTAFDPEGNITREQTAAILYRYANYKNCDTAEKNNITAFSDYGKVSAYAVPALSWANKHKIVNGMSSTVLNPLGESTRAQVALMIMNFCKAYPEI